ncbi:sigma-54-dependent Fis family transcriptional regulator, partial [Myxococcota bacterium]|nr:sigma-54-dependent Fis family transcriptional regulator [Myxococcota bacterium]
QAARWPGNVRELRNVVERAMLAARGRRIDASDLAFATPSLATAPALPASSREEPAALATLADVEKAHVEKVLAACHWNRSAAARVLDIDRRTLFTKIQRYGMIGPLRAGAEQDD